VSAARRRLRIPEVIQTSAMDCGPAALAALLAGFDVQANLSHLRDVCQTDVDGTSIDTLEDVACACGLDAEQVMLPFDHLVRPEARALPCIAVVTLPGGATHFVVLWRRVGNWVQVMDPGRGRLWRPLSRLGRELFIHSQPVPTDDFVAWFGEEESLAIQRARLRDLGVDSRSTEELCAAALAGGDWRACARLDGAVRAVAALRRARAIRAGREAAKLVRVLAPVDGPPIPDQHMAAVPGDQGHVRLRGVVLVRVKGRRSAEEQRPSADPGVMPAASAVLTGAPAASTARELWRLVRAEPAAALAATLLLILMAAGTLVLESLVLRGLLAVVGELDASRMRVAAAVAVVLLLGLLLLLDLSLRTLVVGVGRRLEIRLRQTFFERLPRLKDRYFRTRLTSDVAQRAHAVHLVRLLPEQLAALLRAWAEMALLAGALVWLAPGGWWLVAIALAAAVGLAVLAQPWLRDYDLRARTHGGSLSRFFLDALLGAVPVRAHRAQPAVSKAHEALLSEWLAAGRMFVSAQVLLDLALFSCTIAPLAFLVARELSARPVDGSALLLIYWALLFPQRAILGGTLLAQLPAARNTALRLTEALASADPELPAAPAQAGTSSNGAVAVRLEGVDVAVGGHQILHAVDLEIPAGAHVAVVGRSGAGKSTLLGLLLGWYEPRNGRLSVDGAPLGAANLARLRQQTAWVDPAVHLWSHTLFDNLLYGASAGGAAALPEAIERAELREVIEVLPSGLQTPLGESGRLVSGGQGQRVRLGRALIRRDARLVLLDEPFRGLDREARARLLAATRRTWSEATLLCVTHDVSHALDLDLVVVIEDGRLVECGAPRQLAGDPSSRFAALLVAEREVRKRLWGETAWRRVRLDQGALHEESPDV
jgi:ABC-type bacteriocin/lantibiotic exporter with double-glycine peptidase domain